MTDKNLGENTDSVGDPADFLLSTSKYHDCYLTVGNPETDDVEEIGVSSTQLIAHSPVFRDMLADSELADPSGSNTHIKDVTPAVFKLMLRHVYGGKLPKMTPEEASGLALVADKYDIQRLVGKAVKRLWPTCAENIFPALMCAVYINSLGLELQVGKIVQKETKKIVQNIQFLEIDDNCILFLVKQDVLNINELELWKNLVRWAETQVKTHPEKTLRGCLNKALPYIRLLSLSVEEITKHVLPTKILTPDEFMDLMLAVTNNQSIHLPGICNLQKKRILYSEDLMKVKQSLDKDELRNVYKTCTFRYNLGPWETFIEHGNAKKSTMTIVTHKIIMIDTFEFKSPNITTQDDPVVRIDCLLSIYEFSDGIHTHKETVKIAAPVAPNANVHLPVKKTNGLILEAQKTYIFKISVIPDLPVSGVVNTCSSKIDVTNHKKVSDGISVTYADPFHIRAISYKVQE